MRFQIGMQHPELTEQHLAIELMILLSVIDDPVGKRETAVGRPYSEDLLIRIDQKVDIGRIVQ